MTGDIFTVQILNVGSPTITGRIYPVEAARALVESFKSGLGEMVREGRKPPLQPMINFDNVSHQINKIWFDEEKMAVFAEVRLLATPCGHIVERFMKHSPLEFRLGSVGTVKHDNTVGNDIKYVQVFVELPDDAR